MKELFTNGFKVWHRPDLAEILYTDDLIFDQDKNLHSRLPENNQELVERILNIQSYDVAREYISPYAKSYEHLENDIKGNAPLGSRFLTWHTDSDEPGNVFFLLYLNDLTPYDEGALCIKTKDQEFRIVPQYGTLIAINNDDPSFLHKAEFTEHRRIVACYDYKVEWDHDKL